MGKSADVEWIEYDEAGQCFFLYHRNHKGIIALTSTRMENLNSIIHEINECEVTYLIKEMGIRESKMNIKLTKKIYEKYPWIFDKPQKSIIISHIVSVCGIKNCILSRKHYRLRW